MKEEGKVRGRSSTNKRSKATELWCATYRFMCMSHTHESLVVASFHHHLQPSCAVIYTQID